MLTCFHCNLPVPTPSQFVWNIDHQSRHFCCPGCFAVAQIIHNNGLDEYYRLRSEYAETITSSDLSNNQLDLTLYDQDDFIQQHAREYSTQKVTLLLSIEGMTCAACSWLIEQRIQKLTGVENLSVNLTTQRLLISFNPQAVKLSTILKSIYDLGYRAYPYHPDDSEKSWQVQQRSFLKRLGIAGIGMMQVMMYAASLYIGESSDIPIEHELLLRWVSLVITTPVLFYSGWPFLLGAWRDIAARQLSMNVPIGIAISSAYFASVWSTLTHGQAVYFDSVSMFIFFLLMSRYFEMRAHHRYAQSSNRLLKILPTQTLRWVQCKLEACWVSDLVKGNLILVKAGEIIPADGVITEGQSTINEAVLTGEHAPTFKAVGDSVSAGTINTESPLTIEVRSAAAQSQLSYLVYLLERAQQEKPLLAKKADLIAKQFILFELLISLTAFASWLLLDPSMAFWVALSIMVVTCPCALSLAIPTALTAATTTLRKMHILVTRGHVLETIPHINRIIFDKTGTLTEGNFRIEKIVTCSHLEENTCLHLAASLEKKSEHPISRAFKHLTDLTSVEHVQIKAGAGISGVINNTRYAIGTAAFALPGQFISTPHTNGHWLLLSDLEKPLAWFLVTDHIRPSAIEVIEQLKQRGWQPTLLSGDTSSDVLRVAQTLNITDTHSGLSAEQKAAFITQCQSRGERILMVGDGVNDVLGLAHAHISVAMGSGTDLTRTQADVVLLNNDLRSLIHLIQIAKNTQRIIKQNLTWTLLYNLLAIPIAAAGWITPYWATVGMSLSSMIVVSNALRLSFTKFSR